MLCLSYLTVSGIGAGHFSFTTPSMRNVTYWLGVISLALFLLLPATPWAAPMHVTVNTPALNGIAGQLAFDLIDGGSPANSVSVSRFTSTGGTLGAFTSAGSSLGQLPAGFTLSDDQFFNEYLQNFIFGMTFSFLLDATANPPGSNSFPDGFALFFLDPISGQSLVTTTDPTGANALLSLSIGVAPSLELHDAAGIQVMATAMPEPNTMTLIVAGLLLAALNHCVRTRGNRGLGSRIAVCVDTARRRKKVFLFARYFFLATSILFVSARSIAADVTSATDVKRGALLLNRTSNTFDSIVTLTNIGQTSYASPLKLIVLITPTAVSLSNGTGVTSDGKAYIEIPLPNGRLNQGQSVRTTIKVNNLPRVPFSTVFAVDALVSEPDNLPPDPGPTGLIPLLGIDNDSDGVRDDVQRYIALTYPTNPNAVNALRQLSKTYQEMLTLSASSLAATKSVNDKAWRNRSCLVYLYGAVEGHKRAKALFAEQFNTIHRYRAWSKQDDLLAGQSFESPRNRSTTCDFTVIPR